VNTELGILVGTGDGGYVVGAYFVVNDNIIANSTKGLMAEANAPGSISTSSVFLDNLVWNNGTDWYYNDQGTDTTLQAAGMTVSGTVNADPTFIGGGDYHLASGSPAASAAAPAGAPAWDLDGYARTPRANGNVDIGAFEQP